MALLIDFALPGISQGDFFSEAKKYSARYLAYLVTKAGDTNQVPLIFSRRYL